MRPDRVVVKKALQDAEGNLTRTATRLGCSRQTLYVWIYQLGLERLALLRLDTRPALDKRRSVDARDEQQDGSGKSGVQSAGAVRPIFSLVEAATQVETQVQATVKVRESLWKLVKIEAIRRDTTVGALMEKALEIVLSEKVDRAARSEKQ